jgi:hypothetical protein
MGITMKFRGLEEDFQQRMGSLLSQFITPIHEWAKRPGISLSLSPYLPTYLPSSLPPSPSLCCNQFLLSLSHSLSLSLSLSSADSTLSAAERECVDVFIAVHNLHKDILSSLKSDPSGDTFHLELNISISSPSLSQLSLSYISK